jgi:hypothetical protein
MFAYLPLLMAMNTLSLGGKTASLQMGIIAPLVQKIFWSQGMGTSRDSEQLRSAPQKSHHNVTQIS